MSMDYFDDVYRICWGNGYEEVPIEDIIKMSYHKQSKDSQEQSNDSSLDSSAGTVEKKDSSEKKELFLV